MHPESPFIRDARFTSGKQATIAYVLHEYGGDFNAFSICGPMPWQVEAWMEFQKKAAEAGSWAVDI